MIKKTVGVLVFTLACTLPSAQARNWGARFNRFKTAVKTKMRFSAQQEAQVVEKKPEVLQQAPSQTGFTLFKKSYKNERKRARELEAEMMRSLFLMEDLRNEKMFEITDARNEHIARLQEPIQDIPGEELDQYIQEKERIIAGNLRQLSQQLNTLSEYVVNKEVQVDILRGKVEQGHEDRELTKRSLSKQQAISRLDQNYDSYAAFVVEQQTMIPELDREYDNLKRALDAGHEYIRLSVKYNKLRGGHVSEEDESKAQNQMKKAIGTIPSDKLSDFVLRKTDEIDALKVEVIAQEEANRKARSLKGRMKSKWQRWRSKKKEGSEQAG